MIMIHLKKTNQLNSERQCIYQELHDGSIAPNQRASLRSRQNDYCIVAISFNNRSVGRSVGRSVDPLTNNRQVGDRRAIILAGHYPYHYIRLFDVQCSFQVHCSQRGGVHAPRAHVRA